MPDEFVKFLAISGIAFNHLSSRLLGPGGSAVRKESSSAGISFAIRAAGFDFKVMIYSFRDRFHHHQPEWYMHIRGLTFRDHEKVVNLSLPRSASEL
jgi:hypothetical protein